MIAASAFALGAFVFGYVIGVARGHRAGALAEQAHQARQAAWRNRQATHFEGAKTWWNGWTRN